MNSDAVRSFSRSVLLSTATCRLHVAPSPCAGGQSPRHGASLRREAGPPQVPQLPRRRQDHRGRQVSSLSVCPCRAAHSHLLTYNFTTVPGSGLTSPLQCVAFSGKLANATWNLEHSLSYAPLGACSAAVSSPAASIP